MLDLNSKVLKRCALLQWYLVYIQLRRGTLHQHDLCLFGINDKVVGGAELGKNGQ